MTAAFSQPDLNASGSSGSPEPSRFQRPRRLGDTVVTYLVDRIVSGAYPVDSALPTEPELCQEFAVSRTVIRESIKLLEAKGLVKATPGRGTRVLEPIGWNLLDPLVLEAQIRHDSELSILDDLINVRAALECDMAAQCARVITPAQSEALAKQANILAESLPDPERYAREDVTFHEMIMLASGNRLGHAIIHGIHAKARLSSRYNGEPNKDELAQSLAEHRQIESMILQGDAQGAAAAMRVHILGSWARRRPGVRGALGGDAEG
ncbi:GntR family transcriptional regulator [Sphaerisporangium melleum]|uniref:GntR family transcriptional regulator n=1 Tax=Sphaerisporangium melleum TaxID=321316 RepID=A0A917R9N9_9ACTN|nr:FadR/GntR family transcriptional regulator [Sphaerisporangium melleum]GGK97450.1 GntR family transcriptional regulator [Sphaerisporangium melleum]GII71124.1 GntR family transcriptional regulator [Sphaerisporangium melleum]